MTDQIEDYCVKHQIEIVGRIPYDTAVTHAMVAGKSVVEFSDSSVSIDFHIFNFTRPEGGGCIVIRRRPITL
jgi:MinD superfamily P-loop ATPase